VRASAPGKIILFGEHAVVYGRAALAAPVPQVRAEVDVSESARPGIWIDAPDIGLRADLETLPADQPLAALTRNLLAAMGKDRLPDLHIAITSTIPVAAGMGSGAAVSVALIRALASTLAWPLSDEQISAYAYEIEKLHHGTPSGIDNTVITYAKPVFFIRGQPVQTLHVGAPFSVVIGDSGVPAPTRESVSDVRRLWESDKSKWEAVFDQIGDLSRKAKAAIEQGLWKALGALMDQNQALLTQLTVSSPELDRLVAAARNAGALGAKLSGGGRGGNMIALVQEGAGEKVVNALAAAGSPRAIIATIEAWPLLESRPAPAAT